MAKHSLTDLAIRKFPAKASRYDVWDVKVPGLGVRIFNSGQKSFFLSYRIQGKRRRHTLGRYPEINLAKARELAYEKRAQVSRGEDPVAIIKAASQTFDIVLADFLELHVKRFNKPNTQRSTRRLLEKECLPQWNQRPIDKIKRKDIIDVLDRMIERGSPGAANNAYAAISKFFNWCVSRDLLEINPFNGVKRPSKKRSRDRVLSDTELERVWGAAQNSVYPYKAIVSLLILTGQRRGEVANMEWNQIDWENKVWKLPASLTKNNRSHTLPLSQPALEILNQTPRLNDNKFVFPALGSETTTFSGFGKCKYRLDKEVQLQEHWRLHDLRRTVATGMAKMEIPPHVIERVLNHVSGQFGGVAGIYNRYGYEKEMRIALDKWGDHVLLL